MWRAPSAATRFLQSASRRCPECAAPLFFRALDKPFFDLGVDFVKPLFRAFGSFLIDPNFGCHGARTDYTSGDVRRVAQRMNKMRRRRADCKGGLGRRGRNTRAGARCRRGRSTTRGSYRWSIAAEAARCDGCCPAQILPVAAGTITLLRFFLNVSPRPTEINRQPTIFSFVVRSAINR